MRSVKKDDMYVTNFNVIKDSNVKDNTPNKDIKNSRVVANNNMD